MFLCSLIDELCTKKENDKTGCNLNFGHECISVLNIILIVINQAIVEKSYLIHCRFEWIQKKVYSSSLRATSKISAILKLVKENLIQEF